MPILFLMSSWTRDVFDVREPVCSFCANRVEFESLLRDVEAKKWIVGSNNTLAANYLGQK